MKELSFYPGGIESYIAKGRELLHACAQGGDLFNDVTSLKVPSAVALDPTNESYERFESKAGTISCVFVLVAGGLGERLGASGAKVLLPVDLLTSQTYLEYYIQCIKELCPNGVLAIMTSPDTHEFIETYLVKHEHFGMDDIILLKQQHVPCFKDTHDLATNPDGSYIYKPHGHGDVHSLLYSKDLPEKWLKAKFEYIFFFQDTNALVFRTFAAVMGVTKQNDYAMNSICVPRRAGDAMGAICTVINSKKEATTRNVEYNVLQHLLEKCGLGTETNNTETGYTDFPGNTNAFVLNLEKYNDVLHNTKGVVPEFVNPKFKDASKSEFKSVARIECMMQDIAIPVSAQNYPVGCTILPAEDAYAPVKNNLAEAQRRNKIGDKSLDCALSAEMDFYLNNGKQLLIGHRYQHFKTPKPEGPMYLAQIGMADPEDLPRTLGGITYKGGPLISLAPSFGMTQRKVAEHIHPNSKLLISDRSTLIIEGNVDLNGLELDGAAIFRAEPGARIEVKNVVIKNSGWELKDCEPSTEAEKIRGYRLVKVGECKTFTCTSGISTISDCVFGA